MSKTGKYWLVAFFYAVLFMAAYGYGFNTSDQEEHLPQVYKLLNPSLYPNDYVVNDLLNNFGVRFFYVKVVYLLSLCMPVGVACFALQLVLLGTFCFYLLRLGHLFYKSDAVAYISPAVCLLLLNQITVGGNSISDSMLTCSVFANAFCIAALYYFFAGRKLLPYGLAGAATLFQLLMGLHVFLLMAATQCILSFNRRGVFYALRGLGIYLLTASAMLLPVFYRQFLSNDVNTQLYYYILFVFRNPHHYLPSFFDWSHYVKSAALLLLAAISILIINPRFRKMLVLLLGVAVAGMFLFYVMFEMLGWQGIGKLQWFKVSVWITLLCGMAISGWLLRFKNLKQFADYAYTPAIAAGLGVVLLLAILNTAKIKGVAFNNRYMAGNYVKSDLTHMHEWIKQNTPVDAMIISFPMDESFLCEAQRPMPVAWKAIIHEPWFLTRWYMDFKNYYTLHDNIQWQRRNMKLEAEQQYNTYNNNAFFKTHGVRYRLDDTRHCKLNGLGKVVHVQGPYMLTAVE